MADLRVYEYKLQFRVIEFSEHTLLWPVEQCVRSTYTFPICVLSVHALSGQCDCVRAVVACY